MSAWNPGVVYLRPSDKNSRIWVSEHQCWDRDRFIASAAAAADAEKGSVDVIGEDEYRATRFTARKRS